MASGDILGATAGVPGVLVASWVTLLVSWCWLLGSEHSLHSCFSVSDSSPLGDRGGCCLAGAPQSL